MTKLSAEAYAIVEGRHSDPFHYLGLHTEGGKTVVRAFLPEASRVDAIGEHGETASLTRIHDAGLFAGSLPNGSRRCPRTPLTTCAAPFTCKRAGPCAGWCSPIPCSISTACYS